MATTTSFAPLAARLTAKAHEIYLDLEGQTAIAKMFGLFFCIVFYALAHICEGLDARAAADLKPAAPEFHAEAKSSSRVVCPRLVAPSPLEGEGEREGCPSVWDLGISPLAPALTLAGRRGSDWFEKRGFEARASARLFRYGNVINQ